MDKKITSKYDTTKIGIVRVMLKIMVKKDGKKLISKKTFTGFGLTKAEATANALLKLNEKKGGK